LGQFKKWLDAAAYPVTIDPDFAGASDSVAVYGNNTNFADARSSSASAYTFGTAYKYLGWIYTAPNWRIYRNYHKFDTSSIGAESTVTQVNLTMTSINVYVSADYDIYIVKYDWSAFDEDITNTTNRETAWDALLTSDIETWCNRLDLAVNTPETSGNLDTTWINKTGTTYYGIITEGDRTNVSAEANHLHRMCGVSYSTESYRPKLTVTYTTGSAGVPKHFLHYARMRG